MAMLVLVLLTGLGNPLPGMAEPLKPAVTTADPQPPKQLQQKALDALNRGNLQDAEAAWTRLIEQMPGNPANWSNRGNVRAGLNQLDAAIADYDRAIELAPEQPDAYLNRGAALEAQHHWQAAIADYNRVLQLNPSNAAAFNNRGNAQAGQRNWQAALTDYQTATQLNTNFAAARANYALVQYQLDDTTAAIRTLRNLTRRYPQFADARAALAAALWAEGQQGEAESHWVAVMGLDRRYQDLDWVRQVRRWPPKVADALAAFLQLASPA